jgi:hypothetical protein
MSTDLVAEIREAFANLNPGQRGRLSTLPLAYPAWVYVTHSGWGVALTIPGTAIISEKFSGARLFSKPVEVGHELRLESLGRQRRQEFAVVCAQFLEPGDSGEERESLVSDPAGWWKRWRELLGNALRESKPYSVLGELLAFERLLGLGEQPVWLGPATNSHDIETPKANFEIKSTISKYTSTFHAAGQFQMVAPAGKELFLVHQRFEPSTAGHSIDGVMHRLAASGLDTTLFEQHLEKLGFETGTSYRQITYRLLQSTRYIVDADFPRIVPASFIGGTLPAGIVSIEYEVDLAGLSGIPFA